MLLLLFHGRFIHHTGLVTRSTRRFLYFLGRIRMSRQCFMFIIIFLVIRTISVTFTRRQRLIFMLVHLILRLIMIIMIIINGRTLRVNGRVIRLTRSEHMIISVTLKREIRVIISVLSSELRRTFRAMCMLLYQIYHGIRPYITLSYRLTQRATRNGMLTLTIFLMIILLFFRVTLRIIRLTCILILRAIRCTIMLLTCRINGLTLLFECILDRRLRCRF